MLRPPPAVPGVDVGSNTTLTLSRVHIADVAGPGLQVAEGAQETVVRGDAVTIAEVSEGIRIAGDALVDLARLSVVTADQTGVVVGAGRQAVSIRGLHLFDIRGEEAVLARGARALRLERGLVTQRAGAAVRAGEGADVTMENLRVAGSGAGIIAAGASLSLTDVRLGGLTDTVVFAGRGGALTATGLIVEASAAGENRAMLEVSGGLEGATVTESGFFDNEGRAVQAYGDVGAVELSLERVWVDGGETGDGLLVVVPEDAAGARAMLRLDRVALRDLAGGGLRVAGPGAVVEGEMVVVESVGAEPGFGFEVREFAEVTLADVWISGGQIGAVLSDGWMSLERAVVQGHETGLAARGLLALGDVQIEANAMVGAYLAGGSAELNRVAFVGNGTGLLYDAGAVEFSERVLHHSEQVTDEARCDIGGECPPLP